MTAATIATLTAGTDHQLTARLCSSPAMKPGSVITSSHCRTHLYAVVANAAGAVDPAGLNQALAEVLDRAARIGLTTAQLDNSYGIAAGLLGRAMHSAERNRTVRFEMVGRELGQLHELGLAA